MTILPYIETTGTQYIDTGVIGSSSITVEIVFQRHGTYSSWGHIIGATTADTSVNMIFGIHEWYEYLLKRGRGDIMTAYYTFSEGLMYTVNFNTSALIINGTTVKTFDSQTFTTNLNLYLFCTNFGGTPNALLPSCRLYSCKIWDNGTLIRDFVPVINNGEIGLWDNANNTMYTNDGTGEFTVPTWYVDESGALTNDDIPELLPQMEQPYPDAAWRIDDEQLTNGLLPDNALVGAFANATQLRKVSIPRSVKKIGEYAFRNTQLSSVVIARDCVYYSTSFPDNCIINFYPD